MIQGASFCEHGNELPVFILFSYGAEAQNGSWPPHSWGAEILFRRTTVGRTSLDEWSARRRDLYLKTPNIHNRQTSVAQVVFEPTISASERPQTQALDRAATGTGSRLHRNRIFSWLDKILASPLGELRVMTLLTLIPVLGVLVTNWYWHRV
jgi:hypothetical protein